MSDAVNAYFARVKDAAQLGNTETSYNGPIMTLIESFGCQARDVSGARKSGSGENIDILIWRDGDDPSSTVPLGGIEVKKVGGIDQRANEQVVSETKRYGNVILTDNATWQFWSCNASGEPTRTALVELIQAPSGKPVLIQENVQLLTSLIQDFLLQEPADIRSSSTLAKYMATHAQTIRSIVTGILKSDSTGQPVFNERQKSVQLFSQLYALYAKVKEDLSPGLTTASFADMYAQTIVYGLFIARYNDSTPDTFDRYEAIRNIQSESDLLRLFFQHVATSNPRHETLEAVTDKLCALFRIANIEYLLDKDDAKDTIIHFYEEFLQFYDPTLRKELGVFYTPYQVVQWMVRAVDRALIEELRIEGGLSNNATFEVELPTEPYPDGKKIRTSITRSVPLVSILDPAVGTGTFHAEVIRYVHDRYFSGSKAPFWKDYILNQQGLVARLIGFEIMMTSYVVAHLKVRRTIDETLENSVPNGQIPPSNIFLTNTLTPPQSALEDADQLPLWSLNDFSSAVSEEARRADKWKARRPVRVVIGNPPYFGNSLSTFDTSRYKIPGDNAKKLGDLYVQFFSFAESLLEREDQGILAFISNHAYLSNPTFRGMRQSLLRTFQTIYILDLHGNINKREVSPDGTKDENVFDIMQGVSIIIGVRNKLSKEPQKVLHSDLWGLRERKLEALTVDEVSFEAFDVDPEMSYLTPQSAEARSKYESGVSLKDLFRVVNIGFVSGNDRLNISNSRQEAEGKIKDLLTLPETIWREKYSRPKDAVNWRYGRALADAQSGSGSYLQIAYRPFDTRWTYYTGKSNGLFVTPSSTLVPHFVGENAPTPSGRNVGLVFGRTATGDVPPFVTENPVEAALMSKSAISITSVAPLYRAPDGIDEQWTLNFDEKQLDRLTANLHEKPTPLQVFDYIYAVLHDPNYREMFNDLLKLEYPRVPVVADPLSAENLDAFYVSEEAFWEYVAEGERLRRAHLLHNKHPTTLTLDPSESTDLLIDGASYSNGVLRLNKHQKVLGVSQAVWDFRIGGYPVFKKWLQSHKGERLTYESFSHIENMVGAIEQTIEAQSRMKQRRSQ